MKRTSTIPSMPAPPSRGSQMPPRGLLQTEPVIPVKSNVTPINRATVPAKPSTNRKVVWSSATRYSGVNTSQEVINIK